MEPTIDLDDLQYELALSDPEDTAALLAELVTLYPEHRAELVDFAAWLAIDRLVSPEDPAS